jgi:hypothetical protein
MRAGAGGSFGRWTVDDEGEPLFAFGADGAGALAEAGVRPAWPATGTGGGGGPRSPWPDKVRAPTTGL